MSVNLSAFEENRRRLWGITYRMLGSRADAEDMVQEAWLRWHRAAQEEMRELPTGLDHEVRLQ